MRRRKNINEFRYSVHWIINKHYKNVSFQLNREKYQLNYLLEMFKKSGLIFNKNSSLAKSKLRQTNIMNLTDREVTVSSWKQIPEWVCWTYNHCSIKTGDHTFLWPMLYSGTFKLVWNCTNILKLYTCREDKCNTSNCKKCLK